MKVIIEIHTTHIESESSEKEYMQFKYDGELQKENNKIILSYLSQMSDTEESEKNQIVLQADSLQISRESNSLHSTMFFKKQEYYDFEYRLAFGNITCTLYTKDLQILNTQDTRGKVFVEYLLEMQGNKAGTYSVLIEYYASTQH